MINFIKLLDLYARKVFKLFKDYKRQTSISLIQKEGSTRFEMIYFSQIFVSAIRREIEKDLFI